MNLVAFRTTKEDWGDPSSLTRPARQADLLGDFEGWASYIQKLLKLTKPELDIVRYVSDLLLLFLPSSPLFLMNMRDSGQSSISVIIQFQPSPKVGSA